MAYFVIVWVQTVDRDHVQVYLKNDCTEKISMQLKGYIISVLPICNHI